MVGNGDITVVEDALKMQAITGCDGIMIGRAAIGNPWIFSQYLALKSGDTIPEINLEGRFEIMIRFLKTSIDYHGEQQACRMMRSRLGWFVKGMHLSSKFKESIKHISSKKEAMELIRSYRAVVERQKVR